MIVQRRYARPVLFVADVNRALHFYVDMLGFEKHWARTGPWYPRRKRQAFCFFAMVSAAE
jgi:catechol 2,3-dioxygenase-like lactoylglutathione lyase family enzyme